MKFSSDRNSDGTDVYPVGLFSDWNRRRLGAGRRYLRHQAKARNWRAVRNYFNGYLAEHDGHPHNAGRGWTKRAARRRVDRLCRAALHGAPTEEATP